MARWKNFSVWRGRFPHWRADGVLYYVSLRHRRSLDGQERGWLFAELVRQDGRKWEVRALVVGEDATEALVTMAAAPHGSDYELGGLVGGALRKAGKRVTAATGERFAPFYDEPYDRIVRDDAETEAFLAGIMRRAADGREHGSWQDCQYLWLEPGLRKITG
jgi:hypothetical protein